MELSPSNHGASPWNQVKGIRNQIHHTMGPNPGNKELNRATRNLHQATIEPSSGNQEVKTTRSFIRQPWNQYQRNRKKINPGNREPAHKELNPGKQKPSPGGNCRNTCRKPGSESRQPDTSTGQPWSKVQYVRSQILAARNLERSPGNQ